MLFEAMPKEELDMLLSEYTGSDSATMVITLTRHN